MKITDDVYLDAYSHQKAPMIYEEVEKEEFSQSIIPNTFQNIISTIESKNKEIIYDSTEHTLIKNIEVFYQLLEKADRHFEEVPDRIKSILETLAYEMNKTATKLMSRQNFYLAFHL